MKQRLLNLGSLVSISISPFNNVWAKLWAHRHCAETIARWLSLLPGRVKDGLRASCNLLKRTLSAPKQDDTFKHSQEGTAAGSPAMHGMLYWLISAGYAGLTHSKSGRAAILLSAMAILGVHLALASSPAAAQGKYIVKPIAEMKIKQLPKGPLYWRVENFPTLEQAKAAAGPYRWNPDTVSFDGSPSLVAEVAGKVWLFTLDGKGGATPGGSKVAEIGPVPPITAQEYLLRVNYGSGPTGSRTPVHTHPGSEAFYVVAGRLGQKTAHGVRHAEAGGTMNGHDADMPMEVFNSGTTELTALIMFVVDAGRPFSVPAELP